jgi:hypothetical protein
MGLRNMLRRWLGITEQENRNAMAVPMAGSGIEEGYLVDFKGGHFSGPMGNPQSVSTTSDSQGTGEKIRIKIKPIDVLNQLETVPTPFNLNNLDDKIAVLRDKEKLIINYYAKREITGLIERLQNRKKFEEFRVFFDRFQNTTDEKIAAFLEKYTLEMHPSDIFIPEFPDEAVAVIKEYTEQTEKLCGKKPVFFVIAEENLFQKAYEKRDPILLAQSPFGFYWQILGAWDKEMLLLGEL